MTEGFGNRSEVDASLAECDAERMLCDVNVAAASFDASVECSVFEDVIDCPALQTRAEAAGEEEHAASVLTFTQPSGQRLLGVKQGIRVASDLIPSVLGAFQAAHVAVAVLNIFE